jgi:hypothetical protein
MKAVYFQTPSIKPEYCEMGIIIAIDPDFIYYSNQPCKILISEVKIISPENVEYDEKSNL